MTASEVRFSAKETVENENAVSNSVNVVSGGPGDTRDVATLNETDSESEDEGAPAEDVSYLATSLLFFVPIFLQHIVFLHPPDLVRSLITELFEHSRRSPACLSPEI